MGFMAYSLATLSVGCSKDGLSTGQKTCGYAGKTYRSGTTFPSTDGCNTCSCGSSGAVACTLMACLGDAGYQPADDAAKADLVPAPADVFVPGDDASSSGDVAADSRTTADAVADTKPAADAANDLTPPADAGNDKPMLDAGDVAKDTPSACLWQDASLSVGGSVFDGCNTCVCMSGGMMACTARACMSPDSGQDACTLTTTIAFGYSGGLVAYQDGYNLGSSTGLTVTRTYVRGVVDGAAVRTCAPPLPACGTTSAVSVSTIVADLAAADVQSAFAPGTTPPIFGVDQRPTDGAIWSISLASGGSVLVGAPCPSPTMNSCRPIPAGVQKLADDLKSLAAAAEAESACSGL